MVFLDQVSKYWVEKVGVAYRLNSGGFLGLFSGIFWVQGIFYWSLVGVFVYWLFRARKARAVELAALGLLVGGGVGNGLDRWRLGGVVDFIDVGFWPTFNVADVAISLALGLFLYEALVYGSGA